MSILYLSTLRILLFPFEGEYKEYSGQEANLGSKLNLEYSIQQIRIHYTNHPFKLSCFELGLSQIWQRFLKEKLYIDRSNGCKY